jgi:hypothetical protein
MHAQQGVAERLDKLIALEGAAAPAAGPPAAPGSADGADQDVPSTPRAVELAAMKGMRRRSWTGPAWLNSVTERGHVRPARTSHFEIGALRPCCRGPHHACVTSRAPSCTCQDSCNVQNPGMK